MTWSHHLALLRPDDLSDHKLAQSAIDDALA
jgi:hypothetical protein